MPNEMTPELLALLRPDQREAWERCEKATPGPHQARFLYRMIRLLREHGLEHGLMPGDDEGHDWADADLWANAVSDLPAALLELAQAKAELAESSSAHYRDITVMADALRETKQALAELRAAVDAAPHAYPCNTIYERLTGPRSCGMDYEVRSSSDDEDETQFPCDCWKSRIK